MARLVLPRLLTAKRMNHETVPTFRHTDWPNGWRGTGWRLRWEPARQRRRDLDWSTAHDLACIGGGWLWPNITIKSDGERILFHAKPSRIVQTEPLRFTTDAIKYISAATFEEGIDGFMTSVLARLEECTFQDTDLHSIWSELISERQG